MRPPRAKFKAPDAATCREICQAPTLVKIKEHHFLYAHFLSHDSFSCHSLLSALVANFNLASRKALLLSSGPTSRLLAELWTFGINGMFPDKGMTCMELENTSKGVLKHASHGMTCDSDLRNLFQQNARCFSYPSPGTACPSFPPSIAPQFRFSEGIIDDDGARSNYDVYVLRPVYTGGHTSGNENRTSTANEGPGRRAPPTSPGFQGCAEKKADPERQFRQNEQSVHSKSAESSEANC